MPVDLTSATGAGAVRFICGLVHEASGVTIGDDKAHLVRSRLASLVRQEAGGSLGELIAQIRRSSDDTLRQRVVEALLNNETWFFRDVASFEALRTAILPPLEHEAGHRPVRIWSAACSSGQEPFSIAMLVHDEFPRLWQSAVLLGSDLSVAVLERARQGLYSQLEINRGLPAPMLVRNFAEAGNRWQLRDAVRTRVELVRFDLQSSFDGLPTMDLVLLRNVLLYMDDAHRRAILTKVRRILRTGGALLLGAAESVGGAPRWATERHGQTIFFRATEVGA